MTDADVTWLTPESAQRLKDELDALIANREVIAAEINERREEGDLKENGGYHAAREEQGQQEARIRQLQALLKDKPYLAGGGSSAMNPAKRVVDDIDPILLAARKAAGLGKDK